MLVKFAEELLNELLMHVEPPRGTEIRLVERPGRPNWVATSRVVDLAQVKRFSEMVAQLRKSEPIVDWSAVNGSRIGGYRTVAKWLSEVAKN